jgi:hypothetical protein
VELYGTRGECSTLSLIDRPCITDKRHPRASPNAAIFITLIVKIPVIQIFTILSGLFLIALEFPLPALKSFAIHRSLVLRIVALLMQAFLAILFYQVSGRPAFTTPCGFSNSGCPQGTNAAIWSVVAAIFYGRAIALGEKMEVAKQNRGKGGHA